MSQDLNHPTTQPPNHLGWLAPAALAAGLQAVLMAAYVAALGGDPGVLVCVGEAAGRPPFEAVTCPVGQKGYDGQFYYAIARDPWHASTVGLDLPGIRRMRILYPAASWLLSAGDPRTLVWVMPLINVLAIGALAGLGAAWCLRHGLSPWWGTLLPVALNVPMPALRDLTDVVSTFAVCGLLVAWLSRPVRPNGSGWSLGLWAAAALLSREQNLAVVLVVLVGAAVERRRAACWALAGALATWVAWLGVVWGLQGLWPFHHTDAGHFGLPLAGIIRRLARLHEVQSRASALVHLVSLAVILAEVALALYLFLPALVRACRFAARRFAGRETQAGTTPPDLVLPAVVLGGALMAVLGGYALYFDHWAHSRVFALLPLGLWLGCVQARRRWPLPVMSLPLVVPLGALVKAWTQGV
jgi:hypothetical protein